MTYKVQTPQNALTVLWFTIANR